VRGAGKRPVVAATPAEALATLEREAVASLAIIELRLPTASAGLRLVRRVRQRMPELPLAVLNPTGAQRSRLERTVAPPLLFVGDSLVDQLSQVLRADLAQTESSPPTAETMLHRLELLLERYVPLQLAGERAAARSLMLQEGLAAGLSVANLYRSVLEPAQYRVGDLWGADQISVAREHLASSVTEAVMVDLAASAAREPDTGMRVVVACVQGELHDIGARMVADLLELDGFTVRFLGADVPTDSLVTIVAEELATVLVVSAAMAERLVELRVAVARLRQAYGRGLRIFVGGQVMQWAADAVRALEVDLAAGDALETLTAARRLLTHEPA
ncbi:MAG: cobalamin-dependent protein, partial [Chloroflexi bacterium]|nr:cobalamin-dependent protein [Chloroflexota bacterium]